MNTAQRQDPAALIGAVGRSLQLALSGDLDGAERTLASFPVHSLPAMGLDLLARIALQRGQLSQALHWWHAAVALDPTYQPAIDAVDCFRSGWLARALVRRLAVLAAIPLLMATVFILGARSGILVSPS